MPVCLFRRVWGWSSSAKVLCKLPVPGHPTNFENREGPIAYCACSRCGWGGFGHFSLVYLFSHLSPYLGDGWGGRMVRWCWVNFQCRGVLLLSKARTFCVCRRCGWGLFGHFFSHLSLLSSFSLSLADGPI